MMSARTLLLLAIAGHGLILILLLNVTSGFRINLRWIDPVVLGVWGCAGIVSLGVGIWLWGRPFADWPGFLRLYAIACLAMLFAGFPIATLVRWLRRPPSEAKQVEEDVVHLLDSAPIETYLGTSRHAWILRLPRNELFRIHRRGHEVEIARAPSAIDGLDLLHLTDLHISHAFSRKYFEAVMDAAAEGPSPDLVLITGDFVDHDDAAEWIAPVLGRLTARLGKFAILGNHDYRHPVRPIRRGLRDAGFRVLEGKWAAIEHRGARLALGGTSAPWGRSIDGRSMPEADFRILLSHSPDRVFEASRMGIDLMLAGHVHGGQVRLPAVGPVLMPSLFSRHFDRGFFRVGPTLLHVGQGIAGKHPLRWGCPPELARLVIRSPKDVPIAPRPRRAGSRIHPAV